MSGTDRLRLVVVGGGIAGLSAALHGLTLGAEVTILEGADKTGGKLRTERFAGRLVDCGADAFLTRRPEAVELAADVGLTDLISPASGHAHVVVDGELRALPGGLVLGVPTNLRAVAASRVLGRGGLLRLCADLVLPGPPMLVDPDDDPSVGRLLRDRIGDAAFERLVDPLLSGINAGDADDLSIRAGVPQLAAAFRGNRSVLLAAARTKGTLRSQLVATVGAKIGRARSAAPPASPFLAPAGGMEQLAVKATRAFVDRGGSVVLRATATSIEVRADGFLVRIDRGAPVEADAVVVAVPPRSAAPLLAPIAAHAAAQLASMPSSSVALVAFAYRPSDVGHALDGSGFLVPRDHPGVLAACSWFSKKWPQAQARDRDGDLVVLRASAGRAGDVRAISMSDDRLVARLHEEMRPLLNLLGEPVATRVSRWVDGFPIYEPGHNRVVAAVRADLPPGLTAAGAAFEGVGVPACIASGRRAAATALAAATSGVLWSLGNEKRAQ